MNPVRRRRLLLVLLLAAAAAIATTLVVFALQRNVAYLYTPAEVLRGETGDRARFRLGGMVEKGSIKTEADGVTIAFVVGDGTARVPVRFKGIVPSLFVEGSGVVAEGKLGKDGTFVADNLLAKHDENYVPREMKDMTADQARKAVAETQ